MVKMLEEKDELVHLGQYWIQTLRCELATVTEERDKLRQKLAEAELVSVPNTFTGLGLCCS